MPDLRNGGVVSAEHPHQVQHYGAAVQVPQGGGAVQTDPNSCGGDPNVVGLRQGIPPHHYGGPGQPPQGMPYPRFPPYDRMDIRNAAYYGAQQQQMDGNGVYSRPDSPGSMHMGGGNGGPPNGHQTPVVYASCKLQAAAVGMGASGSPPLDATQTGMGHHMANHHEAAPQHHHMQGAQVHPQQHHPQQHLPQQQATQQQHMMYGGVQQQQPPMHQQQPPMHQQPPPNQQQSNPNNTAASLPSPLYPWMRSQFGKCRIILIHMLYHSSTFINKKIY